MPGRFLGLERPLGSNIVRVPLGDGRVTHSQSFVFADAPLVLPPVLLPAPEADVGAFCGGGDIFDENDSYRYDNDDAPSALVPPPAAKAAGQHELQISLQQQKVLKATLSENLPSPDTHATGQGPQQVAMHAELPAAGASSLTPRTQLPCTPRFCFCCTLQ